MGKKYSSNIKKLHSYLLRWLHRKVHNIKEGTINLPISVGLLWNICLIMNEGDGLYGKALCPNTNIVCFPPTVSVYRHV